jgi:hypothetical protein
MVGLTDGTGPGGTQQPVWKIRCGSARSRTGVRSILPVRACWSGSRWIWRSDRVRVEPSGSFRWPVLAATRRSFLVEFAATSLTNRGGLELRPWASTPGFSCAERAPGAANSGFVSWRREGLEYGRGLGLLAVLVLRVPHPGQNQMRPRFIPRFTPRSRVLDDPCQVKRPATRRNPSPR